MNERADLVLEELADGARRLRRGHEGSTGSATQRERVLQQIAEAEPVAGTLLEGGDKLVDASVTAREQLKETQGVLERANEQFERALEMAEPLDRMTTRAARIAGTLRRDSGDE